MAAGATGIDYHTGGAVTSSGAAMRARQSDQSGGTDAGDLEDAWRTYGQTLTIRDVLPWDRVTDDLAAGRLVMLDVWHASMGGVCLAGSGNYGHTVAVAPERSDGDLLVSDPWCRPARWSRWPERYLRAGAEEWGRRVLETAGPAIDRPALRAVIRELFSRWTPQTPATGADAETGGGGSPVFYTVTQPGDADMSDLEVVDPDDVILDVAAGTRLLDPVTGAVRMTPSAGRTGVRSPYGGRTPGGTKTRAIVWTRPDPDPDLLLAVYASEAVNVRQESEAGGPADEAAVRAERDAEWIAHLTPP
jgi:hypothetical protein